VHRLVLLAVVAAATAGVAAGAGATRGKPATSRITAVDAAGGAMAVGLAWTPKACEGAMIWSPGERAAWTFRLPRPCPATRTGRGVAAVSSSAFRVVFLSYVGGSTREWRLWTATRTAHTPRLLRSASAKAGEPAPILLGNGGDGGIPYAVGRTVVVLSDDGTRTLTWTAPGAIAALNATYVNLAVTLADGDVVVVPASGSATTYAGVGARNAQAALGGAVYETPTHIVLRRGKATRILTATPGARLVAFNSGALLYRVGGALHLYRNWTGKDIVRSAHIQPPYLVDADRRLLAWASRSLLCSAVFWNDPTLPLGRYPGCTS
jgi:hypothetical protein